MSTSNEIRQTFLDFFQQREHRVVPSAAVVPMHDPTLMFVNAGMVPFKNVFTGQQKRPYHRAASAQKCIRVSGKHNDLENVGVTARHHTFFEMLGNFSFGDYFKEEAIVYAWDFLTRVLGISADRLLVTVFGGEGELVPDSEAEALWRKVSGLPAERIIRCGAKDNFWQMGDTGPCGPCSEIHYYFGEGEVDLGAFDQEPGMDGRGWVELWNLVFMQFERQDDGQLRPLPAPSIDTGMGMERLAAVVQGVFSNYDSDLLRPVVDLAADIAGKPYGGSLQADDVSMRVIADHARATAFLVAEGVFPDRDGRPYVLRRIMRRAIRHGHRLGIERHFFHECALKVVEGMGAAYPELREHQALIADIARQEEERFRATLRRGLERLSSHRWPEGQRQRVLPGEVAFELYDTYGFPLDLQQVIGQEQGFHVDVEGFERELAAARERSAGSKVGNKAVDAIHRTLLDQLGPSEFTGYEHERGTAPVLALLGGGERAEQLGEGQQGQLIASPTPFYAEAGGQVGDRGRIRTPEGVFEVQDTHKPLDGFIVHEGRVLEGSIRVGEQAELEVDHAARSATRRNHSATHLLHLALRQVLGPQAIQKGSLVSAERLRFDYSAARPLEPAEIERIEDMVNERVLANTEITTQVLPMDEAKSCGAIGIFEEKYGDVVRMLRIGDSLELCGGTHARRTGDIGAFKILSDNGIAAGVRRIEAATGLNVLEYTRKLEQELSGAARLLRGAPLETRARVERALARQKELAREVEELKRRLVAGGSRDLSADARAIGDVNVLGAQVEVDDPAALRELADRLRDKLAPSVVVLGSTTAEGKALLVCTVSKQLTGRFRAGVLIKDIARVVGGKGGGRPDFAQAGGADGARLGEAVERVYQLVETG